MEECNGAYDYTLMVHIIVTQNFDPPLQKTLFLTKRHDNLYF